MWSRPSLPEPGLHRPDAQRPVERATQLSLVWISWPKPLFGIVVTQWYLQLQAESVGVQKRHSLRLLRKHRESRAWGWGQEKERSWPWCFWHKQLVWYWCLTWDRKKMFNYDRKNLPFFCGEVCGERWALLWPGWLEMPEWLPGGMCFWQWACVLLRWWAELRDGPVTFRPHSRSCSYLLSVCPHWKSWMQFSNWTTPIGFLWMCNKPPQNWVTWNKITYYF